MPRGHKDEIVYTGKALKIYEKVQKLETDLKSAKEELKVAYKDQIRAERAVAAREKKAAAIAAKKELKENKSKILKAIKESGRSVEEILEMLAR